MPTRTAPLAPPCRSEPACVSYFFSKRWPRGFCCPFCGAEQLDQAPALVVVCRLCRRQTSITAHTVMHGSKKGLIAWIRVAHCFCAELRGLSARRLQHLLALSCYQTAWNWLQRIRQAAALAEAAPCSGTVLLCITEPILGSLPLGKEPTIALAVECGAASRSGAEHRLRLQVLPEMAPTLATTTVTTLVAPGAALIYASPGVALPEQVLSAYHPVASPDQSRLSLRDELFRELNDWLNSVFRGGIDRGNLQHYLDEFTFRHNTASWTSREAVLDHLLDGLIAPLPQAARAGSGAITNKGGRQ
jgi:hypothetical protein